MPTVAVDIDNDVLSACRTLWQTDHATLPALLTEPPKAGRLKSPQTMPYAHIACELDHRELVGTDGAWHDHRRVSLTCYGTKAQVTEALAAVLNVFNLRLGAAGERTLEFPSGARFIRWLPVDGGTIMQDPETKDAFDIWEADCTGLVWSIRTT